MNRSNEPDNYVFDIKEKIATGSFGSSIFKAYDASLGQVAIAKKYPANITNDYPGFMNLLDIVRQCNSMHVVRLYGYYKASRNFWVVMEYCHGHSIYDLMERLDRPLKENQIRTVLNNVLKGLEVLHSRNIVHTRIKARNILITTFGTCKVSEPGSPVIMSEAGINMDCIIGNSYWSAPEVLLELGNTSASDIWSLGITLIEMAERQPPYAETHPSRVMVTIPTRPPPQLLNPDAWSKALKNILSYCLQKNPTFRQSAAQLLSHKIIKKADMKGMHTMVQKAMKSQQSSRFTPEAQSTTPTPAPKIVDDVNDTNWAESGTLVWNPQPVNTTPKPQPPRKVSSEKTASLDRRPHNIASSSTDNFADCDNDTMKASTFAKYKAQISEPGPPSPGAKKPVARLSKTSENIKSAQQAPRNKPVSRPPQDISHHPEPSVHSPTVATRTPQPNITGRTQSSPQPSTSKKSGINVDQAASSSPKPVKRASSAAGALSNKPVVGVGKRKNESDRIGLYDNNTITVNMASGYTPSYMDFYEHSQPPLVTDEDEEPLPAPDRRRSITDMRRNSIDQRGIELEQIQEELKKQLGTLDADYCKELEELRDRYIITFQYIKYLILEAGGEAKGRLEFYAKMEKSELTIMLTFIGDKNTQRLTGAKQHFDLQHKFLMDALQQAKNCDEETEYNLKISENNEEQTRIMTDLNKIFQHESEAILKAIEKIDYADAFAQE